MTYTPHLNEQLIRAYVDHVEPTLFIEKTLDRGAMRISPAAMPIIAAYFEQHASHVCRIPLSEKQINDLLRIGVSGVVLASHPDAKADTKNQMLRKDLDV